MTVSEAIPLGAAWLGDTKVYDLFGYVLLGSFVMMAWFFWKH